MSKKDLINITKDGGITKMIIKKGTGKQPTALSKVKVHYVGHTLKGVKFDSSRDRHEPFQFVVGEGSVIQGWDLGVPTMKIGEVALLTIRPKYGYGKQNMGRELPPNSTLIFEIELLSFNDSKDWRFYLEQALILKEDGNKELGRSSFPNALSHYDKALKIIDFIPINQISEEDKDELMELKKVIHLNSSLALINKKENRKALTHCKKALKIEPRNAKALFRKALCLENISNYDGAIKTLEFAIKNHPENEAMKQKLILYQRKNSSNNNKKNNNNNNNNKKNNNKKNNNKKKNNNNKNNQLKRRKKRK
ncbi:fk506-binding protein [Anaeramoeba flamelloides]|uniref:peptidylprolyl isomerase n=1 Tax=Anaeramoeba flamelloides TaxID=1746091 RepID=A0AAV7ZTV9_9EUKA|nr:fk506-binding protein [Anaeramoeba flamelloides]